ncbi:MAG TPA: hypothetical protein VGD42_15295 [Lysobacter sp.]
MGTFVNAGGKGQGRRLEGIAAGWRAFRRRRVARLAGFAVAVLPALASAFAAPAPVPDAYFIATPQLENALKPLSHLPPDGEVELHASVVIVPDPAETRLGKSFDMAVAAVMSAYQARGYELDGFALSWKPVDPATAPSGAVLSTADFGDKHRSLPSLLLFRRDRWREAGTTAPESKPGQVQTRDAIDVAYDLVYLVGDSPSYGIQPRAFEAAARCALLFDDTRATASAFSPDEPCDRPPAPGHRTLQIIGPSFSGSMQSLAVAIGRIGCKDETCAPSGRRSDIDVRMISPSASVSTNPQIARHGFVRHTRVEYDPLAWDLEAQMLTLTRYLCRNDLLPERRIVFLVEESTFGRGAGDLADEVVARLGDPGPGLAQVRENCLGERPLSISVRAFSPNISSIRAEHSRLRKAEMAAGQKMPVGAGRLLELDMTSTEPGTDRPPPYQPALTSRSDELMLYRMFDSLRVWGKPDAVVIVATDVRDRIFLLSEVRKSLPWALPAMLEMDYLMVHPDYRATSRGALVVSLRDPLVCVIGTRIVSCRSRNPNRDDAQCGAQNGLKWVCQLLRERKEDGVRGGDDKRRDIPRPTRYAFSTDQAANMFRAVFLQVGYRERTAVAPDTTLRDYVEEALCPDGQCEPRLSVATLAGFASLDEERRSTMVAADARLALQRPWYLATALLAVFFFLVGVWLFRGARGGSAMSNFARHVITDARWLTRHLPVWLVSRDAVPPSRSRPPLPRDPEAVASLAPRGRVVQSLVALMGALVAVIAMLRLWQVSRWGGSDAWIDPCLGEIACHFSLAHGRDVWAVYCLFGLYACLAILGVIRLGIAGRRHEVYGSELNWSGAGESTRPWLVPTCMLAVVVIVFYLSDNAPVSVDSRSPWLLAMLALVCGVAFLVALASHVRQLIRITLWLSRSIGPIHKRKDLGEWPSPRDLQETMQTPFNLSLGRKDVDVLKARPVREWIRTTRLIIDGDGGYPPYASMFDQWQRQLVAELKLLVVAIRFAAWCAMAAPVTVLLAMTAYPPVYEPQLRTMSIGLLLVGFACTVLVVLRLEKNPMLGPMYTSHGDDLSFGGALRALWPKFVAMAAVLIPLVMPDVWRALHALIRSINSLG